MRFSGGNGRRRWRWYLSITVLLLLVVGIAVGLAFDSTRWRLEIVGLKAVGKIEDVSWGDLLYMLRPGSGYWLEPLAENGNPYAAIENIHNTQSDIDQGRQLFVRNCSSCHATDARGSEAAPALVGRDLKVGDSDWVLYRTIRFGVLGTAMASHDLPRDELWRLVAYVRNANSATKFKQATKPSGVPGDFHVSYETLASTTATREDWLTYSGTYSSTRHSALNQITRDNVKRLAPRWQYQFPGNLDRIEATPIVHDGIMFVTEPPGRVLALNAATGALHWDFLRRVPNDVQLCCATANRGVAMMDDKIFVGTLDAHLLAVAAVSGKLIWDTKVATYTDGYSITAAPLATKDLIITGVGGGDYGARGFISAYEKDSGKERWRFWTVPGPGEPGNETWQGDSWKFGGSATWMTGSYDAARDIIYWGVGNAAPDFVATKRSGDNLYSASVIALQGASGKRLWHFQFTPGDDHNWDANNIPVLVDRIVEGKAMPQLLWPNRNAFFYVFNRVDGKFLLGLPFATQTWADG
ncbi:MAG TPA: PQQ-binding-like beta-propeller repeat protein, partial [Steroidobacteraceae bacterium]|nr:PQQ-binding-like beta-propeller repeat protein [Steroidobacteraceae bacterium]